MKLPEHDNPPPPITASSPDASDGAGDVKWSGLIVAVVVGVILSAVVSLGFGIEVTNYTDHLFAKLIGLVGGVFVVNFIYTLVTGKTIKQARNDKAAAERKDL